MQTIVLILTYTYLIVSLKLLELLCLPRFQILNADTVVYLELKVFKLQLELLRSNQVSMLTFKS